MNRYNTYVRVADVIRAVDKHSDGEKLDEDISIILEDLKKTQITRCSDCDNADPNGDHGNYYCVIHNAIVDANDFCSW